MRELLIYLQTIYLSDRFHTGIMGLENPKSVLSMTESELKEIPGAYWQGVDRILKTRNDTKHWDKIKLDMTKVDQVLTIVDEDYPKELRYIERPPNVLYIKGKALDISGPKIAIVGARKSTAYGQWAADKFATELVDRGATIISGMAQGIDGRAHKAALEAGGYSIGVLGCGVDIKFPKNHSALFDQMYQQGTILSEYPIGVDPMPRFFPERNRIISGLSDAVIVIEAKDKSGSLITGRLGAEQGKEVYALPGNIDSLYSVGTNKLIRDGAIPLLDITDITDWIDGFTDSKEQTSLELALSDREVQLINHIKSGNNTIDNLARITDCSINEISPIITLLEMKNVVTIDSGIIHIL